jgi:HAD superfamily hydrolase (TIGR01509 family)
VAVEAVVFDLGETLVDETGMWERAADAAGVPRFTLMGILGGLAARGESHTAVWGILGADPADSAWRSGELYPDALPCIERLRGLGLIVGAVGNTSADAEEMLREHVDLVGSSERWQVEKPAPEFFARLVAESDVSADRIAYVGDRVDNDVRPALDAGMVAVHVRRGPWAYLHEPPAGAVRVRSLDELPGALDV